MVWIEFLTKLADGPGVADIVVHEQQSRTLGCSMIRNRSREPVALPEELANGKVQALLGTISADALKAFEAEAAYSFQTRWSVGKKRARVTVVRNLDGLEVVMRIQPETIPTAEDLLVPNQIVTRFDTLRDGLVLVVGATGTGKSSTIASLVLGRAQRRAERYLTIEDPIEYVYPKDCLSEFTQREVGTHCRSFHEALKESLRLAPHVIMVGEINDAETVEVALRAAISGHLVVATLHTNTCDQIFPRMVNMFPAGQERHVQSMLADVFRMGVAQQLVAHPEQDSVVAIHEILFESRALSEYIRKGDYKVIPNLMRQGVADGMQTFEQARLQRVQHGYLPHSTMQAL